MLRELEISAVAFESARSGGALVCSLRYEDGDGIQFAFSSESTTPPFLISLFRSSLRFCPAYGLKRHQHPSGMKRGDSADGAAGGGATAQVRGWALIDAPPTALAAAVFGLQLRLLSAT